MPQFFLLQQEAFQVGGLYILQLGDAALVLQLATHVAKLPIVVVNCPLGEPPDLALQLILHDSIL